MNKFITKENILICVMVFVMIAQSNYFATKLDLAKLQNEMLRIQAEVKEYSDKQDKEILHEIKVDIQALAQQIRNGGNKWIYQKQE